MTQDSEKLSAFLDGQLSVSDTEAFEQHLQSDPDLRAELEALMGADQVARDQFDELLRAPVPLDLARAIQDAPDAEVANTAEAPPARRVWPAALAVMFALLLGGVGGYWTGQSQGTPVASAPGWLQDIAEYHAVYATQKRHLVEVPATEQDHIQTWLSNTLGVGVAVPDLSGEGLEFQGARLLVAAGKPVAQLMYLDAQERVVALCLIAADTPRDGFADRTIGAFSMVSWGGAGANFVIVGDEGRTDLRAVAQAAAIQI